MSPTPEARLSVLAWAVAALLAFVPRPSQAEAPALRVVTTTTDLADLAREVGGDKVLVASMLDAREDPHAVAQRPAFVAQLRDADLLVVVGLQFEAAWLPKALDDASNPRLRPDSPGFLDASGAIPVPFDAVPAAGGAARPPAGTHPAGNPHYLLDPLAGLDVARRIATRLSALRPEEAAYFDARFADFRKRLAELLAGPELAAKYDAFELARLAEQGGLDAFLQQHGDAARLHGLLGAMRPFRGRKVVDDHPAWIHFARRYGLELVAHLEPVPGTAPTPTQLQDVIDRMKAGRVKVLIASPGSDPAPAEAVSQATGARIVPLVQQVGGADGADTYLDRTGLDVRAIALALMATR